MRSIVIDGLNNPPQFVCPAWNKLEQERLLRRDSIYYFCPKCLAHKCHRYTYFDKAVDKVLDPKETKRPFCQFNKRTAIVMEYLHLICEESNLSWVENVCPYWFDGKPIPSNIDKLMPGCVRASFALSFGPLICNEVDHNDPKPEL